MLRISHFDTQKMMGALTSIISGGLANGLNFIFVSGLGLNPVISAVLALQIIGGFISYSFDIMFAKKFFYFKEIPYSAVKYRFKFLSKSILSEMFIRFIIATIIMSIVYYFVYKTWMKYVEQKKLTFKYHEYVYAVLISCGLYFLFNHILLFDYVYQENERSIGIDITVIGIMLMTIISFSVWKLQNMSTLELNQYIMR